MKKIVHFMLLLVTTISFGQSPIHVFKFDNSMSNNANTSTFVGQGANASINTSFSTGATGRPSSALSCSGGLTSYVATIANLPVGNSPRTISFWFRSDNNFQNQHIFSYGQNATNQAYGYSVYVGSGITSSYYGFGNDMNNGIMATAYNQGQWYLYVCTFDGTTATIYRNGNVLGTSNRSGWNTFASTTFNLGSVNGSIIGLHGAIDDLKIYNVALNSMQVTAINTHRHADITASSTLARESNPTTSSITLNYRVDAGNLPTNVTLNYGTSAGNLASSVQISNGIVNGNLTEANYILAGLNANSTYYYTLTAENESGRTVLAERSFSTAALFSTNGLIGYFPFENALASHDNSHTFTPVSATGPTFVTGRVGNGAMFDNDTATGNSTAIVNNNSINDALTTNTQYTVAFWVDNMNSSQSVFPTFVEMFSSVFIRQVLQISATAISNGYFDGLNFKENNVSPNINAGLQHIALVHKSGSGSDRLNCALYVNGVFINTISDFGIVPQIARSITKVSVGGGFNSSGNENSLKRFRGIIDELYFYNRALTPGEVLAVMNNTNQTLGNSNFNVKKLTFNLYPNPATSILNIDLATRIKSVVVYSLLGQKVLSDNTKQVNIAGLSNGVYMVKVEDENGDVATQKLVKE